MRLKLGWIGAVVTVLYFVGLSVLIWNRLSQLQTIQINELGDFLSGAFGPVAFFWLVLGFLQQGQELKLSSDALRMQAEELRASVEQQTSMAKAQQEALDNHERSLEPLLDVSYVGPTSSYGQHFHTFELTNRGPYCRQVIVQLSRQGTLITAMDLAPLTNNFSREFNLDANLPEKALYKLVVSYEKTSDKVGVQEFALFKNVDEGQITFSIIRDREFIHAMSL